GLDKAVALSNFCFAIPLAVFGGLHLFGAQLLTGMVPKYMPFGSSFWVYFIGIALIAAALSIATKIKAHWSGVLFGIMMFSFVLMLYLPFAIKNPHARITRTIVFRETSFGGAAWILAGLAINGWNERTRRILILVGRICIGLAAIVFGIETLLHP